LVSLQPVNGLSPLLVGAMKKAPDNWFWWIRMHPDMRSKRMKVHRLLQSLHRDNWSLFEATDLPLYSLLKVMDVHITEYSAVVLEAEMFGISSIITHPLGRDFFQRQIQRRMVFEAYHLEDLLSKIEETSRRRTPVMEEEKSHADELLAGLLAGERYMN
jgi:transcriptional regulator with AAA-type ATPase domain